MTESFELKPLSAGAVAEAIKKAEHYRLLNEPEQAESICLDVLEADPKNQKALVVLILAITDQFSGTGQSPGVKKALEFVERLDDEYHRLYYSGIIQERQARAALTRGMAGVFAYEGFRDALHWYEKAEAIRPKGIDDPILRWNACARTIDRENLRPRHHEGELPLE
jgi:hypothetical protein